MIVLSYDCDSEYLKVLLSSKLCGNSNIKFEENISSSDSRIVGKKGPVLINGDNCIESGNSISLHLLPPLSDQADSINTWLQWEHSQLSPQLILFGNNDGSSDNLKNLLSHLNDSLVGSYLLGETLTVADICTACALYPLLTDYNEKAKNLHSSFSKINSWFNRITSLPEFKDCENKIEVGLNSLPKSRSNDFDDLSKSSVEEAIRIWDHCAENNRPKPKQRTKPILPKAGERNILITSALPYVNNVPHLGNIIGCVLSADVFSRFCRLRNWNTLYICGTDEFGTATETKALDEGLTPQEICDKYFAIHSEIYQWFNVDFDLFGRTTTQNQKEVVQQMFKECHENGYTLTAVVDQLLCENCDRYLADRFVEGICPKCKFIDARGDQCDGCGQLINAVDLIEPKCKQCRNTPVVRQSKQLFLDLPQIEPKLREWVEKSCTGWTHNARVITKSWLREGLKPRCITRDLKWGIPVPLPGFESKVFYVWFDAPIGYMSMTKTYSDDWLKWWRPSEEAPVTLYQFMAKDNVPFHSIMFPATLFASRQNYITVNHLMATEYLNYEDGKFSKSRGVGVFGNDAKETGIPSDIFRFYLLYVRPESQDSSFSWADLAAKSNTDLLNNLGNFVNRALMFSSKFFNGEIPNITLTDEEKQLIASITKELVCYLREVENGRLREGIKYLLNISRHGNQYIQANQPWVLIKGSDVERERAGTVTGFACQMVCLLTVLLHPYMPQTSDTLKQQINLPEDSFVIPDKFLPYLPPGHKIGKPSPLFMKIEPATVEMLKQKYAGRQKSKSPEKVAEPEMTLQQLEQAIEKQAQLVRILKESGKGKDIWQPEVSKLLDLKKKLSGVSAATKFPIPNGTAEDIQQLERMITEQGEKVRQLKQTSDDKAAIQNEVKLLLDLKNKLSIAKGEPVQSSGKKKKK